MRAAILTLAMVAVAGALAAGVLALGLGDRTPLDVSVETIAERAATSGEPGSGDPLAFNADDTDELARRATLGTSHVIFEKSPEGVVASAERTARWRPDIERAAADHGVEADTLEAMIFLESAGRPTVMAGTTPEAASGLAQIIPSTATDLLGMKVDLARSIAITRAIQKAARNGRNAEIVRLMRDRAAIDERFQPEAALQGAARYLQIAEERFGSSELAVVSYHMGIGNLENVIDAYGDDGDVSYPQLFFDSSPTRKPDAWRLLSGFGDDSSLYLWRVRASQQVMREWRDDPGALADKAELITAKATLEELFHPEDETEVFETPEDVGEANLQGELVTIPDDASLGFRVVEQAGELADELGVARETYRVLRPEALAALTYLAAKVKAISGERRPLRVTSAARDRSYQDLLTGVNPEATTEYSLHTTGWSFDILRDYGSERQAAAFQFALDRLRAHAIIDYALEPAAVHITVSETASVLAE